MINQSGMLETYGQKTEYGMSKKTDQTNSLNVLVVEDDTDIGRLIEAMLHEMGMQKVTRTRDGRKALIEFKPIPEKYQIIISDWEMPEMNGLELLKAVREINSKTLFLMLTGRSDTDAIMKAQAAGVNAYIVKPFTKDQLLRKMGSLVEMLLKQKKQKEDENHTHVI